MAAKSIFYKYPQLYIFGIKLLHGSNYSKRNKYMADYVKDEETVLEPGCGPAIFADYLPSRVRYTGFDLNTDFIDYASKENKNVYSGNVLLEKDYKRSDVVIICDLFHHIPKSKRNTLIKCCFQSAKRLFIFCDPCSNGVHEHGLLYHIKEKIISWPERDGLNNVTKENFFTRNEMLKQIKNGFGIIPKSVRRETKEIGSDFIAVFHKKH